MALSLHPGVPVDSQNRKSPVITNWIHSSIYVWKAAQSDLGGWQKHHQHCHVLINMYLSLFFLLQRVPRIRACEHEWTSFLSKSNLLNQRTTSLQGCFCTVRRKPPQKKKGDKITPLLHLHTCWMLRNCRGYLWAAMPEQFHSDKTARIQKAQRR